VNISELLAGLKNKYYRARGRDAPLDGEVREELPDLFDAHISGVALAVKEDEAPDSIRVRLLGAQTQVSGDAADAVE
jgi:hypothetical protein